MARVIFLDFDGVIVHLKTVNGDPDTIDQDASLHPCPDCVRKLDELCRFAGAQIVVSSTWRLSRSLDELRTILWDAGLHPTRRIVGVTPQIDTATRGHEIAAWLKEHPLAESYVVLDDDQDMGPIPYQNWVHISEGFRKGGLTQSYALRAFGILMSRRTFSPLTGA